MNEQKPKAIIVGGSIAGLSCAHTLIMAGWQVIVIEKSTAPPTGTPTGAGLGLDLLSCRLIESWLTHPQLFHSATLPLTIDLNQVTDSEKKVNRVLIRDENFNFRAAHWADLHRLLYSALPPEIFLWGHVFLSFRTYGEKKLSIEVKAKVVQTNEIVEINGNLLVAADGCLSSIRQTFVSSLKLRYSGYCAWRGVYDCSGNEDSEIVKGIRSAYPELGDCLYFDLVPRSHAVLYELSNKRLNWVWYVNQPEPELKGNSVTTRVNEDMITNMHREAEKTWVPELSRLMKITKEPFVNFIYDCDPLEKIFWDNVVLIGEAAHPTTPHGLRSTNMSILDAAVLGKCLKKWGVENLHLALEEYQSIRLPVIAKQVLCSRKLGKIKQGLPLSDREAFDPTTASLEESQPLQQKNMPFFDSVPSVLETA
ncbi:hypothetical protein ACFE04_013122 [Oxalis oulophora]